jgi:TnpA family transposase
VDGLLYHETDLDIHEHYADTGGYTDQVFGMTHLLGFRFAPRLRDLGRIEKTLFTLEWFQSVELRRRVQVGLNKGEARNALARAVFFYRHGRVQDRSHAQQQQQAQGLNLVVAAIILWNTLELARAIDELRSEGVEMTAEQIRHLSPMDWEHISLTGEYTWDFASQNTRS